MKSTLYKWLVATFCVLSFMALSTTASAWNYNDPAYYHNYNHGYYQNYPDGYRHYGYYHHCRWVYGHWYHHRWVPAGRVC